MKGFLRLVAAVTLTTFGSAAVWAQHQTAPSDPGMFNEDLEIGPIQGLTTLWHRAPVLTAVPLKRTLKFRVRSLGPASWTGARVVRQGMEWSIAEFRPTETGEHIVMVEFARPDGERVREASTLEVVDVDPRSISIGDIRLSGKDISIDADNPNASSMRYYFRNESIARVSRIGPDHFRTSTNRWFTLEAETEPRGFSPLIEWRHDGTPLRDLGTIRMQVFPARAHTISAGPVESRAEVRLDTYMVFITSHRQGDSIPERSPITFRAVTHPPGYEEEITWLASTKYGSCDPPIGQGPEWTVEFRNTVGAEGRWLGVKADNAVFDNDDKGALPSPFDTLGALRESTTQALIQAADSFGISSCDPPCPGQICCADGSCVDSVTQCSGAFGLATETLKLCTDDDVIFAGMAIDGLTDQGLDTLGSGRDVMFGFISVPQAVQAVDLRPGFYTLRVSSDPMSGEPRARFLDGQGESVVEVPASFTLEEDHTAAPGCEFIPEARTDELCPVVRCCIFSGYCVTITLDCIIFRLPETDP